MYQALCRALILSSLLVMPMSAALADSQKILITDVWARATIGVNRPGAVYLSLTNIGGETVKLTGIRTGSARTAEVHLSETDAKGVTTMKPAGDITLPPGRDVELQPGGLHVMLMGLKQPLVEGDSIKLELLFDDGGSLPTSVQVRGIAATGPSD